LKKPRKPIKADLLTANVSTLKTHLGRYLKSVVAGNDVVVLDRKMPVAKLVAFNGLENSLDELKATTSLKDCLKLFAAHDKLTKPTSLKKSSAYYLSEDRGER
jgi:antitoxin (DNA-binding transcriptional repressor) of toxin-antitoxin stability system